MFLHKIEKPVRINTINILEDNGQLYIRSISEDGIEGFFKANGRLQHHLTIMEDLVLPFFINKDARDLKELIKDIYTEGRNYKYASLPFWNCVGHIEVTLFDILGKTVNIPVGKLLGNVIRSQIPVYLTRFNRDRSPEEEIKRLKDIIPQYGFEAVKLKIGGRMSYDKDVYPGYSEELLKLAREKLGDEIIIYVDANGSYSPKKAVEVGKMLQKYNVSFFEEPCPWQNFAGIKYVNDNLEIPVAGGEQDSNLYKFEWMIENQAVDIIQPDIIYNGGIIRCLQVAKMAEKKGINVIPHAPRKGIEAAPLYHFLSVINNAGPYHESRITDDINNTMVNIPKGPGLGYTIDENIIKNAKVII